MTKAVQILKAEQAMAAALACLQRGEPVAIPTETVYGLAADATNGEAVAAIFKAKRRPRFNPLICHVSDMGMARRLAEFDPVSERLAEAFWPGPLTIVLPLKPGSGIHPLTLAGLDTVGLRMPQGFARDLIAAFGRPLAAPSANSSGRISATSAEAVAADLGARIALVVDGGPAAIGVESTIVRVSAGQAEILRPGGISAEAIAALGIPVTRAKSGGHVVAPGMLASHYAPRAALRLDAASVEPDEALLAFGPVRAAGNPKASLNLSPSSDLSEAARNLFSHLQALDAAGISSIAAEPVPHNGLGAAINDRLARAAAPRPANPEAGQ